MSDNPNTPLPYRVKDKTGQHFGRLTVEGFAGTNAHGASLWRCVCDCPERKTVVVLAQNLTLGKTKSCGCIYKATRKTSPLKHGGCYSPLYYIWCGMHKRCYHKNHVSYARYGALGVRVQESWHSFPEFEQYVLRVLGPRPSADHTIDRFPNKTGNYEEGNIRWATKTEQQRNMKSNVILTFDGQSLCIAEWTELKGWSRSKIQNRLRAGWPVDKILSTP